MLLKAVQVFLGCFGGGFKVFFRLFTGCKLAPSLGSAQVASLSQQIQEAAKAKDADREDGRFCWVLEGSMAQTVPSCCGTQGSKNVAWQTHCGGLSLSAIAC